MSSSGKDRVFQLFAGNAVLDFVNTLDWRFRESGTEELLLTYDDLLLFVRQSELLKGKKIRKISASKKTAPEVLAACLRLREALAEILYAIVDDRDPASASLKILDRCIKEARSHQHLVSSANKLRWEFDPSETSAE